ncbi:bestrophin-like domain [Mycolicibacterium lacusdiani]|uniref:bestrophin-like domain n=1 Tax=Mycolicibacterium lacusdiani TaxID=2895283 RepID=UPI001F2B4BD3|nr:DUF4239 domain-containing protein [Mycolicibacterium lacusdiani]
MSVAVAVAAVWLSNRLFGREDGEFTASLSPFLTTVALVYGALLGFTVVVAWEQFSSAEATVSLEASTLTTMYRQTVGMPQPEQRLLREAVRNYTVSVSEEWDSQYEGDANDSARSAITDMYRILGHQGAVKATSPLDAEFLKQLSELAADRNARFLDAKPRIPGLLWGGLLFGGLLLISMLAMSRPVDRRVHVVLTSSVGVLLGLLLFIVFWLDRPFGRDLGVTPAPFSDAQLTFDAIDEGT